MNRLQIFNYTENAAVTRSAHYIIVPLDHPRYIHPGGSGRDVSAFTFTGILLRLQCFSSLLSPFWGNCAEAEDSVNDVDYSLH